jgi:hypothetical protein
MAICIKKAGQIGVVSSFLDAKESHWAAFRRFHAKFRSSFCFLNEIPAKLAKFQVEMDLDRNNSRSSLCLKQLQQSHYLWLLACQLVQIPHHLRDQHQSQCQNQLSQNRFLKKSKTLNQEPLGVLGARCMATREVASC